MKEYPETHQYGMISIHNQDMLLENLIGDSRMGDLGIQVASDGRIWVCIDGVAFIRFKPRKRERYEDISV